MSLVLTASEVKKHNTRESLWMVIRNDVYDVTSFINEHPGGEDPLIEAGGLDATSAFDDVGHSADARSLLKKYKVGTLAPGEKCGGALKWVLLALTAALVAGFIFHKYS